MQGGRFSRGWALAKQSWAVLKADRSLAIFPVLATVSGCIAMAIFLLPGTLIAVAQDREWIALPFLVGGAYAATFMAIYFSVALTGCAVRSLDGADTTVSEGIRIANSRLGPIAVWALIQTTVGFILSLIRGATRETRNPIVAILGLILSALLDIAWAVMTFFVVPVLALEGLGPIKAIKRSAQIVKERWGEGLAGTFSIQAIAFLFALPGIALIVLGGFMIGSDSVAGGIALGVIGAIFVVIPSLIGATLQTIFRVALYRFATTGQVSGFDQAALEHAFEPRKPGRRGI
jgi:hypothetical protein